MFKNSILHPDVYLNASLSAEDLTLSLLATNGMKVLRQASTLGGIPLTKSGAFYRKFVEWAAEDFQWPGFEPSILYSVNKVLNEPDLPPLSLLHDILLTARLMRHLKGRAVLTKVGKAILGHPGSLQVVITERLLTEPYLDHVPLEAVPIFWDMRHMLGVVGNRLDNWATVGDFTEWVVPVDLFPSAGPFGPRYEASFFIASNLVRPLSWLGLVEEAERNTPGTKMDERLIRKSQLFDRFVRILSPSASSIIVH